MKRFYTRREMLRGFSQRRLSNNYQDYTCGLRSTATRRPRWPTSQVRPTVSWCITQVSHNSRFICVFTGVFLGVICGLPSHPFQ